MRGRSNRSERHGEDENRLNGLDRAQLEAQGTRFRQREERERPEPTAVWQTVGVVLIGFSVSAALAAVTISEDAVVTRRELWLLTAALLIWGATCLLAHLDVNRGRRARRFEVRELPGDQ